jgi:hypothetical protein
MDKMDALSASVSLNHTILERINYYLCQDLGDPSIKAELRNNISWWENEFALITKSLCLDD